MPPGACKNGEQIMTSKQRAELRAQSNTLDPVFQIGKEGVTDAVISQIEDTFNTRELFKIKVHLETTPTPVKETAAVISEKTGCEIVQVVGGTIVLFRINPLLRQKKAEKEKRAKEKAKQEALRKRTEKNRKKYGTV